MHFLRAPSVSLLGLFVEHPGDVRGHGRLQGLRGRGQGRRNTLKGQTKVYLE